MATTMWTQTLILSFVGLCMLHLVASVDTTALSVALPTIAQVLHATTVQAYWTGTAFVLSSAVLQPVFAAASNAFGKRSVVLFALALFTIGTVVCGTAPTIQALIAGRAVQGTGGGGIMAVSQIIITDLFPLQKRPIAIALIGMVWLVGTSCGPLIGGGFTESIGWDWIFWICLPLVGVAFGLIAMFLRTSPGSRRPIKELERFDWVGAGLFISSLTSFLLAITWGGTMFPWGSYHTIVPLVVGGVGFMGFLAYETLPAQPMISAIVFRSTTTVMAFVGVFLMGIAQFAMLFFLPLYYEVAKGYSPLAAGAAIIPTCVSSGLSTFVTGAYISKTHKYTVITWIGWTLLSLGSGLFVLLGDSTSIVAWIFIDIVPGIGLGALFSSLNMAAMASQAEADQPAAAALMPFFRTVGNTFGIAIGNAVYQNVLKTHLLASSDIFLREHANEIALNAEGIRALLRSFPSDSAAHASISAAFVHSLRALWWTQTGVSLLGGLASLLMREHGLVHRDEDPSGYALTTDPRMATIRPSEGGSEAHQNRESPRVSHFEA